MRNRKSRNVNGVSVRDRMIARIMVLILTVSMMPYQAAVSGSRGRYGRNEKGEIC